MIAACMSAVTPSSRCRVVLVGDPKQLPATVKSLVAQKLSLARSLFERLQVRLDFGVEEWQACDSCNVFMYDIVEQLQPSWLLGDRPGNSSQGLDMRWTPCRVGRQRPPRCCPCSTACTPSSESSPQGCDVCPLLSTWRISGCCILLHPPAHAGRYPFHMC